MSLNNLKRRKFSSIEEATLAVDRRLEHSQGEICRVNIFFQSLYEARDLSVV
jgi:hypothetical protein